MSHERAVAAKPGSAERQEGGGPGDAGHSRAAAPLGRRLCRVVENRASGAYRVLTALDPGGPAPVPGQFYMLASEIGWGSPGGRPYLPRAFAVAAVEELEGGRRLAFLAEEVGPGTERLCRLADGAGLWMTGPLGNGFSDPGELAPGAAGAILVGGGIGIATLAVMRRHLRKHGIAVVSLLGFRDRDHVGGLDLFSSATAPCPGVRIATEDGHAGHRGRVTELLAELLAGDDAGSAAIYACGPPAMLEAVRTMCAERGLGVELAMEAPMACGFGACMGCAVPLASGGYMRLCVDGPVVRGERIETALVAGSGH